MKPVSLSLGLLSTLLLAACAGTPAGTNRVSLQEEQPIRAAAQDFTSALKVADGSHLQQITTAGTDADTRRLAQAVLADTLSGRQVQLQLAERFHAGDEKPTTVGSDAWIAQIENAAAHGEMLQAGNRVRIGEAGHDGTLFLRHIDGQWKIELVPTLVVESGGRTSLSDPIVDYRFNVTHAVNEHLLTRLQRNDFASLQEYEQAKTRFWFQYMTYAANGDDPHDKLLSALPPLPKEDSLVENR